MQRWDGEQAPGASVLLRTGALMSLASLGTAGLVLCGALAVGVPAGDAFSIALGDGPASVTDGPPEPPTGLAPSADRSTGERPELTPRAVPVDGRSASPPMAGRPPAAAGPLSGTTSSAARTPTALDGLARPARDHALDTPSAVRTPSPEGLRPQRPRSAVRVAPAGPVAGAPEATARPLQPAQETSSPGTPAPAPAVRQAVQAPGVRTAGPSRSPQTARPPRAVPQAPAAARAVTAAEVPHATTLHSARAASRVAGTARRTPAAPALKPARVFGPSATKPAAAPAAPRTPVAAQQSVVAVEAAPDREAQPEDREHPKGGPPGKAEANGPKH